MAASVKAAELQAPNAMDSAIANILIVDDLPEKLLVFRSILEDLGQNLVMVRSGKDALRQVLEHEFAVILLDVNMPDIDGFETASMIRQYKKTAQTPIIFITAYADDLQVVKGYSLGAVDYIATPVIPEILRSKVKVFVDLYRMNQQVLQWAQEREALVRAEAARAAAEEAGRRADFLAEASHILTRSLDGDSIICGLLNLVVPELADIAMLTLADNAGHGQRTEAIAQHVGMIFEGMHDTRFRIEAPPHLHELTQKALRSGEGFALDAPSIWKISERSDSKDNNGDDDRSDADATCIAIQRVAALPLRTGTQTLGVLTLAYKQPRGESSAEDALANEIASRAAIAIENGLLYSAIQQGDQRKNEFLAMLAHELRNPLAPIRNAVHVMQSLELENSKVDWAINIISHQIAHITRIVDDLLDVSRIARGKVVIQKNVIALDSVLKQALETSRPHIDAKSHQLHIEGVDAPVFVEGDLVRLTQVFANLLNNAAKYTPAGGHIWLATRRANGRVSISVRDSGEGISGDFLPHIFDLFTQANQAIDRSQGGLGVGLTLVKQLVELHDGRISASSSGAGCGSAFVVELPEHTAPATAQPRRHDAAEPCAQRADEMRVLVVDDLVAAADSMRVLLEHKDYRVETAYDGPSAVQIAQSFLPHVILLDIGLPGIDGFEVARRLRTLPQLGKPLLIALTGYGQDKDRQLALDAGFDTHLVKPADIDKLCALIAAHGAAALPAS